MHGRSDVVVLEALDDLDFRNQYELAAVVVPRSVASCHMEVLSSASAELTQVGWKVGVYSTEDGRLVRKSEMYRSNQLTLLIISHCLGLSSSSRRM